MFQIYVSNSARFSDQSYPFGYLKASSSLSAVNLFVMPYNYPVLLPLLGEQVCHVCVFYGYMCVFCMDIYMFCICVCFGEFFFFFFCMHICVCVLCVCVLYVYMRVSVLYVYICVYDACFVYCSSKLPFLVADELFKVHKLKPNPEWRQRFEKYLKSMPGYYAMVSVHSFLIVFFNQLLPQTVHHHPLFVLTVWPQTARLADTPYWHPTVCK